jgi:molybdenum cofactor cytidylyltransferase
VIPAAGLSSRMGRPKLLLPLGGQTIIERVVRTLTEAEVRAVTVVGPAQAELAVAAKSAGADVVMLAEQTPDMRATVLAGLDWIEGQLQPRPGDPWLLIPADHPTLNAAVIQQLRAAPSFGSIRIPSHQGQRGHPVLIDWKHVAAIRQLPAGEGINVYFRRQAAETCEVPVDSADVLLDLDTPEDYQRLLGRFP